MAIPTLEQWKSDTSRWWAKRSPELKAVDDALDKYNKDKTLTNLFKLDKALQDWMLSKTDWTNSTRNTGNNADVVKNLADNINNVLSNNTDLLEESYTLIKGNLQKQIQGTCGIYSFYSAVCILRELNNRNPHVPPPKKCYDRGYGDSLRAYAKRQLQSGQGEILDAAEMVGLVEAHGYTTKVFNSKRSSKTKKKQFIEACIKAGYPVLIPYLADSFKHVGVTYTNAITSGAGAHWSLIIGADVTHAQVIEPNAPNSLKTWPIDDLLESNAMCDRVKFVRYWAKLVHPKATTSIDAFGESKKGWMPSKPKPKLKSIDDYGQEKLYDLGGKGKNRDRHQNQCLNDELIAVIPPHDILLLHL